MIRAHLRTIGLFTALGVMLGALLVVGVCDSVVLKLAGEED